MDAHLARLRYMTFGVNGGNWEGLLKLVSKAQLRVGRIIDRCRCRARDNWRSGW